MKNDDDFIHLPELYIKLGTLKKHLQKTYKLNINPMKNSDQNVNWSDLNKNLNAGYDDEKMAMISCDIIHEYAVKLDKVVKEDTELEDWVKSKISKTEQMMASVKHALIGIEKYDHGGELFKQQLLHIGKYAQAIIEVLQDGTELMSWMESNLAVCADHMDNVYHHLDYKMGNRAKDLDKMKDGGGVRESENFKGKINKDIKYVFVSDTFDSYLGNIPKIEFFKDYESAKKSYIKYLMDSNNYMGNWTMALYECDDDCSIYSQDNTKKVKNAKKLHRFEGSNRYVDGKIIDSVNEKNKNFIVNLIDENNEYKNGGGVSDYGVNYNIVFEKPDSDMAWKETINASSEKEARAEFKKKHPTCTILNIFEAYANGGGVKLRELDDVDLVLRLENKSDFDLMNNEYGGDFPALNPRTFEFFVNFDNVDSVDAKEINEYESYIIDNLKELGIKNYYFDRVINKFNYANGGGVDENDEYELKVKPIKEEYRDSFLTYWTIEYRKKGYKKPLFSNPFKKSEADWTPLIPKEDEFSIFLNEHCISISIGEYQEAGGNQKVEEEIAKNLNDKYGIIDAENQRAYWTWPYNEKTKEYRLRIFNLYSKKELAESIAKLLSSNNDKLLKEILRRKQEILQEEKEEKEAQKNYKKPSYFANGGGIGNGTDMIELHEKYGDIIYVNPQFIVHMKTQSKMNSDKIITQIGLLRAGAGIFEVKETPEEIIELIKSAGANKMANGGNVGRDAMFRSQEPHEQRYDRKREYKEYKKEGWLANDWFDNGGGVGYFKSGYTLKGRKGKYWIDDVEGRVTKDRYFEKEEDAIAEIDLLSRFKKLKNEQRVKGPSMENLMEADRYYTKGGGVTKD
jgi:hypothetical protein